MKKIALATVFVFLATIGLLAQTTRGGTTGNQASAPAASVKSSYMMIGGYVDLDYFFKAENTTENFGVFVKAPISDAFGMQVSLGSFDIPIKSYQLNDSTVLDYEGVGKEEYFNFQADFLYYFWFSRNFQVKLGFDYYRYIRGEILDTPGAVGAGCGIQQSTCYKCSKNLLGVNLGVNLDVPIYKDLYLLAGIGSRYIIKHPTEKFALELSLGLGYKL